MPSCKATNQNKQQTTNNTTTSLSQHGCEHEEELEPGLAKALEPMPNDANNDKMVKWKQEEFIED